MCAINPAHKKRLILDVYTSEKCSKEEFNKNVALAALDIELSLNESGKLRWHVKETDQEAD